MYRSKAGVIAAAAGGLLGGALLGAPLISSATTPGDTTDTTTDDTTEDSEDSDDDTGTTGTSTGDSTPATERSDGEAAEDEDCRFPGGGMPGRHPGGPGGPLWHDGGVIFGDGALTELLGISAEELRERLGDGQTIAEIAEAEGVAVDTVIQTLVDEAQAAIDERSESLEEHVTDLVNGELPTGPRDWQPSESED